mmetsp:Transcript_23981/g.51303  ORF Transcript_23981/g.51303 Transcript_23981/m.51303 type:complete len:219 (+) Transcript_23981:231-887(+)
MRESTPRENWREDVPTRPCDSPTQAREHSAPTPASPPWPSPSSSPSPTSTSRTRSATPTSGRSPRMLPPSPWVARTSPPATDGRTPHLELTAWSPRTDASLAPRESITLGRSSIPRASPTRTSRRSRGRTRWGAATGTGRDWSGAGARTIANSTTPTSRTCWGRAGSPWRAVPWGSTPPATPSCSTATWRCWRRRSRSTWSCTPRTRTPSSRITCPRG